MFSRLRSAAIGALLVFSAILVESLAMPSIAIAQTTVILSGTVQSGGKPVSGATVTLRGGNLVKTARTDASGTFSFPGLGVGEYSVEATQGTQTASQTVELGGAGATVTLSIDTIKTIGRANGTVGNQAGQRSGTDVTLNAATLTHTAQSGNLSGLLVQNVAGAARGANGTVHINGDHGDINYVVDGVPLPIEINRAIGSEFDPSDIAFAEVLQGAYPAQYGGRFAAVVNIGTLSKPGPAGYSIDLKGGSFAGFDSTGVYHSPIGNGGSLVFALRNESDGRALDPPNVTAYHDRGSNTSQLLRLTLPHGSDFFNFTVTHALQTYQIPNDVEGVGGVSFPASTDDTQRQDDLFASFQFRHAIGDKGAFSIGPSFKRSKLLDTPDYSNDIVGADPQAPPLPTPIGATPALCANAVLPSLAAEGAPTGGLNDCALSINADRTSLDYQLNADYVLKSTKHEVRAGATYDTTRVLKNYDIAFQPNNYFSAGRFDVTDDAPNVGHTQGAYLQDTWRLDNAWEVDYGLRADAFQLGSTQFHDAESMISPRLKVTRYLTPRSSVYGYYGRFFTPYSFENVSPSAAACINPNVDPNGAGPAVTGTQCTGGNNTAGGTGFDLKAQRDSVYEFGGSLPVGSAQLGFRAMQKNSSHIIDDVVVGFTNLHQDINYASGRITVFSASLTQPLPRNGRAYLNVSRTQAEVKDCETQLLAACVGQAPDYIPADHDQRYDVTAGALMNDRRGGWLSLDAEYGSGLSTVPTDATLNTTIQAASFNPYCLPSPTTGIGSDACKSPPHLTFDAEKGIVLGHEVSVAAGILNLFQDRYFITYQNAQGYHYAQPRAFYVKMNITH